MSHRPVDDEASADEEGTSCEASRHWQGKNGVAIRTYSHSNISFSA